MKKRFLWHLCMIVLASLLMLQAIPVSAAEKTTVYYFESFEDCATNQVPDDSVYTGFNTHVVEYAEQKKALYMEPTKDEMVINIPLTSGKSDFFFTVNMAVEGEIVSGGLTLINSNTRFKLVNIKNNSLATYDGKKALPALGSKFSSFTVHYSPGEKRMELYSEGKLVLSKWYVANGPTSATGIELKLESESFDTASIMIDSILVYSTPDGSIMKMPEVTYNPESLDWESSLYDPTPQIYLYKNFDTPSAGLNGFTVFSAAGAQMVESGDESYYRMANTDAADTLDASLSKVGSKAMFEVMLKQEAPGANLSIYYVDLPNGFDQFLTVTSTGSVTVGNAPVGMLRDDEWNHLAISTNFSNHTHDVWLNGKLVAEDIARRGATQSPIKIRMQRTALDGEGAILIDSMRIYSGEEISVLDDSDYTGISILGGDNSAINALSGKYAVHGYSNQIAVNGERKITDTYGFVENEIIYSSKTNLCEIFGAEIDAVAGSTEVTVGEQKVTLEYPAIERDGQIYLPAKDLAEKLGKVTKQHERGVLVIADEPFVMNDSVLLKVNNYMQYGRLSPEETIARLSEYGVARPRVRITQDDVERLRTAYTTADPNFMKLYNDGKTGLFFPSRTVTAQSATSSIYWHTIAFAIDWLVTGDDLAEQKVRENVNILCSMPNWHVENDTLGRAQSTITVAMAYDWFYDEWTEEERAMMENAIIEYGLKPVEKVLKGTDSSITNFLLAGNQGNNITAITASGAIIGASAVWEKSPELASYIIAECTRGLEMTAARFYPDGGWEEGSSYAAYMAVYHTQGMSTIKNVLGTDCGLMTAPGVKEHAYYQMALLGNRGANNFHDGAEWELEQAMDAVNIPWAAHVYNSSEIYQMKKDYKALSGIATYPEDILYYRPDLEKSEMVENPLDYVYQDVDLFSMRNNYNKDGIFLSAHYGIENAAHGHYDGGSFVLDMLGERWAIDLGKDDYNLPGYFVGGTRGTYYRLRPEGHNTFVINPDGTEGHSVFGNSPLTKFESSQNTSIAIGDLSSCFPDSVQSAKRGFMLTDNRETVIIRDEIRSNEPVEYYWFMHTPAEIEIVDKTTAILTQNGKQIRVSFLSNAPGTTISKMDAVPLPTSPNPEGQLKNEGVTKIAIHVPSAANFDVTVRITPVDSPYIVNPIADISLDNWSATNN